MPEAIIILLNCNTVELKIMDIFSKIRKIFTKRKIIVGIIVLGVVFGGFYGYKKTRSTKGIQYKTAIAKLENLSVFVEGTGNIIVDQSSAVDPTITGTVADLAVNIGDRVEKGQFLFNIDNDEYGVNVARAYAAYSQSFEDLETAKANKKQARYDLDEGNDKQKAALKQKYEAAQNSILSAQVDIKSLRETYEYERENAAKRKVVAPISGTVNAVNIKNGDDLKKLTSGSSRIIPIIIGDLNTMKAQVLVNEVDISNVSIGQKAEITFSGIDDLTVGGKVEKIDSLGTIISGVVTYNVIVGFDNLDPRIKPQMTVTASIIKETRENVIAVPKSAVKNLNNQYYIEILEGNSSKRRKIEIGESNNTLTEIVSGISIGDEIITQTIDPNKTTTTPANQNRSLRIPGTGGGGRGGIHIH